jgi:hypothetical protein
MGGQMHSKKAEVLGKLTDASTKVDAELTRYRSVVGHPSAHPVQETVRALAALPLLGLVAVAVDAAEVLVRRSADGDWEEAEPKPDAAAPPNGEL